MSPSDLIKLTSPPLSERKRRAFFQHFLLRLTAFRNISELYANTESLLSSSSEKESRQVRDAYNHEVTVWAQELLNNAWVACQEPLEGMQFHISD